MSTKNKIFVNCEDANHFCDKNQYKEASFWEKVKLNIHLIYCGACRKYSSRNGKLSKLFKDPKVITMEPSLKDQMKKELEKRLQEEAK